MTTGTVVTTANVYEHFQALLEVFYSSGWCESKISIINYYYYYPLFTNREMYGVPMYAVSFGTHSYLGGYFIIPTSQMRKLRLRMVRYSHSPANR